MKTCVRKNFLGRKIFFFVTRTWYLGSKISLLKTKFLTYEDMCTKKFFGQKNFFIVTRTWYLGSKISLLKTKFLTYEDMCTKNILGRKIFFSSLGLDTWAVWLASQKRSFWHTKITFNNSINIQLLILSVTGNQMFIQLRRLDYWQFCVFTHRNNKYVLL